LLPHGMEVGLHTMLLERTGEVRRKLCAELTPGSDGSWSEVHKPSPSWPGQGYMKVTCHDGVVTSGRRDGWWTRHIFPTGAVETWMARRPCEGGLRVLRSPPWTPVPGQVPAAPELPQRVRHRGHDPRC
jgi:hypothetical protein